MATIQAKHRLVIVGDGAYGVEITIMLALQYQLGIDLFVIMSQVFFWFFLESQ